MWQPSPRRRQSHRPIYFNVATFLAWKLNRGFVKQTVQSLVVFKIARLPEAFSVDIKRGCFGTNWVPHQRRYQLRLNKARCQIQQAKTTCFTEKCGEPDGRRRPGRSRAPSSCVWLARDLDSSRTRPCWANVHRFSIFTYCVLTLYFVWNWVSRHNFWRC